MANTKNSKEFIVSTADFLFYHDGKLACSGTTNLNATLSVSMESQDVTGGKGSKQLYSYKYGRKLSASLETANWDLSYIAAQTGSEVFVGLSNVYKQGECVVLTAGVGTLSTTPIAGTNVAIELPNGLIVEVTPTGSTISLVSYGLTTESVKATYKYSAQVKSITIDAEKAPLVGTLVLNADKHNNKIGKVADVQIEIPSYQLDGNFEINFTPDGAVTTNMNGNALAVEGDSCADGSSVYAYIKEIPNSAQSIPVAEIAATPATVSLAVGATSTISVLALRGGLYKPSQLDNTACTFTSSVPAKATVSTAGVITGVAAGTTVITVAYGTIQDTINVTVA